MNLGFKKIVETTAKNIMTLDGSYKGLFSEVLNETRGAKVTNIKQVEKNLIAETKQVLEELNYSSNVVTKIVKVIKLACNWYDKKLFLYFDEMYFYNIENGLRVLDAIQDKYSKEETLKVSKRLNRIKFEGDKRLFNDAFETKLNEIKKEYNILDIDGKMVSLQDNIKKLWANLNETQKEEFKNFINGL